MAKTLGYVKKAGLVLTMVCLLGSPLSALDWSGSGDAAKPDNGTPAADIKKDDGKPAGEGNLWARTKDKLGESTEWFKGKAKPATDHLSTHKGKYCLALGIAVTATTKWLYEKGKVNYLVASDAILQDEFRRIDENPNFDALEKADEKQKAVARRVAEYFADESILDAIMKSTQGLWSYLF